MRARTLLALATLGVAAWRLASTPVSDAEAAHRPAVTAAAFGAPRVAFLATLPGAEVSSLYLAEAGASPSPPPVATLHHLPDATVRARVLPGTSTVVATAETTAGRDPSFSASLFRVTPHEPAVALCDGVAYASSPLVTRSGRVFVARGVAGPEPLSGVASGAKAASMPAMRVDRWTTNEIDPATGAMRAVHTYDGYLAFLAGALGDEIVVYRVDARGADLVAIDADTGSVRVVVASMLPFARDFSVDEATGSVVFQERSEASSRRWVVDSVDLATGARTRLAESASMTLSPFALPGGGVAWNPDAQGLAVLGGVAIARSPAGPGVDVIRELDAQGAFAIVSHTVAGALPSPFVLDLHTGKPERIATPRGTRVALAGFVAGAP